MESRAFCKSNYWDYCTLDRADQIRSQLEFILTQNKWDDTAPALQCTGSSGIAQHGLFTLNEHRVAAYYDDIVKCLLTGYFMNVAVQGFGGKYWTFRVLTLDDAAESAVKAVEIIDKASCHPTSAFYKNNTRNWVIFHQIQISHSTQLRVLTAIQPRWLTEVSPRYYDTAALANDNSPIAKVLTVTASDPAD